MRMSGNAAELLNNEDARKAHLGVWACAMPSVAGEAVRLGEIKILPALRFGRAPMCCMNSANLKVFFGTLVKSKPGADMIATTSSSVSFFSLVISM
jgi:hypothetical protein